MNEYHFSARPEKHIQVPIPGTDLHINAILRGDWAQPVVILVHGLACDNRGLLPFLMARMLAENGFASLRINLYDQEAGTRDMIDCTMSTHAQDFDTVVRYVRNNNVPAVLAAGHSYGGLTILSSTSMLDAAVLWEPSHFQCSYEFDVQRDEGRHYVAEDAQMTIYLSGIGEIAPSSMAKERIVKSKISEKDLAVKPYPLLFVAAGRSVLVSYVKKYFAVASSPKKLIIVPGASHSLTDSDEIILAVFSETLRWFKSYTSDLK